MILVVGTSRSMREQDVLPSRLAAARRTAQVFLREIPKRRRVDHPTGAQTSKLARRVCAELAAAGWRLERVLTDNGGEFAPPTSAPRSTS